LGIIHEKWANDKRLALSLGLYLFPKSCLAMTADVEYSNRPKEKPCDVALSGAEAGRALRGLARGRMLASVETPVKSGTGTVSLIPAEALETFERPKVGYPKGRPRLPAPDAGDVDREE
jgi:hypothetical protein